MKEATTDGSRPSTEEMAEACEIGANVQLALSRDKVSKDVARRLIAAAETLRSRPVAAAPPKPKPAPAGERLGASRIGDLARAADAIVALKRPGPNGTFLVDADDMKKLAEAVRPFQVLTSMHSQLKKPRDKRTAPELREEGDDDDGDLAGEDSV